MPSLFVRNVAGDWFGVTCLLVYTKKEDFALSYIGKFYFLFSRDTHPHNFTNDF